MSFPDNFLWGAATSSYQIEGAVKQDGRGSSIWDDFCYTPGKVANGDTGDIAIDHYNRMPEDLELMTQLGLQAYRFSIAWPRIKPLGRGQIETRGLDFYDRLIDGLLARNIVPLPTLYHWDLPSALQQIGGWTNRDTAEYLAEYTTVVVNKFKDRVDQWATLNEPWVSAFLGHAAGIHAPGIQDPAAAFSAAHHLMLAHGKAVEVIRQVSPGAKAGIVLNLAPVYLTEPAPEDHPAHKSIALQDAMLNRWWLDGILKGSYPSVLLELGAVATNSIQDGDLAEISRPIDWIGVNYYQDSRSVPIFGNESVDQSIDSTGNGALPGDQGIRMADPVGEVTDFGWSTTPDGLRKLLLMLTEDYENLPQLFITENGCAYDDPIVDGRIHDARRIEYIRSHLKSVEAAIAAGADVGGYMVWSLFDNFEWAEGYRQRFGIIHVDFETQVRTLRDSAYFYKEVVASNGGNLG
jgi:beta-glucosidase